MEIPVPDLAPPGSHGSVATDGKHDAFTAARRAFWARSEGAAASSYPTDPPPSSRSLLSRLVEEEYGTGGGARHHGPYAAVTPQDVAVARLRNRVRSGRTPGPEECVRLVAGGDGARGAVFDAWPEVVRLHGGARATRALRSGFRTARDPGTTAVLLHLAAAAGLRPVPGDGVLRLAAGGSRKVRHAAWRLLARYGGPGENRLRTAEPADAYERLLLEALRHGPRPWLRCSPPSSGLFVAQSMLMGRFDRPGEGLSGGLSVLLESVGEALASTDGIAGVLTVVTACRPDLEDDPVLLRRRSPGHWILRLPVDADRPVGPQDIGAHREALAWWAARLMSGLGRPLDVLHVRYADDGSLALAEAARRVGAGLVFTATPDPHRQMTELLDRPDADPDRVRLDLHRVFLADRLVDRADRVVGIAGRGGTAELLHHFPQLARGHGARRLSAPPEGVAPYAPPPGAAKRCGSLVDRIRAKAGSLGGPRRTVLLSVGRLHPVKQQDVLVRAWIESGCHRASVLVLVGGSTRAPDRQESLMRDRIRAATLGEPEAREHLLLLPALSNADVRSLERTLTDPAHRLRARYVCASAKEEFGLAVLEAMEAGMVVAGPERGGVPHYLDDGVNGLLLDTSTPRALGRGLRRLLELDDGAAEAMARRAQHLVRTEYSAAAMARALADHYADAAPRGRGGGRGPSLDRGGRKSA
ncbi:glycosyltransferase family 4 protein [Streptomyces sp. NPDC058757]|uniref:glycosyltransferase family 4 protein n=1 Tax=Streptomyces sp. NPDC058757 TaxID=3346626 RepID=UPI0036987FA9